MPTQCSRDLLGYEVVEGRQVVAAFDGGEVTSDAGALLLGATDRAIGVVARFAACFDDGRAQAQVEHSIAVMVAQRIFGIALGYEDLVDHDQLRHDPVLAALAGKLQAKRKGCAPLAGKSTLNRLEHAPLAPCRYHKIGHDAAAIEGLFVDLFLDSHATAPLRIILDLDATDDPLHGHQEGRFFHGYSYEASAGQPAFCRAGDKSPGEPGQPAWTEGPRATHIRHEAGQDHAVDVLGAPGVGPHHLERAEGPGAGDVELDHAELGQQVAAIAAVAPVRFAELGHALEVLVDQLVHPAAQQLGDRVAGALPIVLGPFDTFGLHGLHHPKRSG
jgi:hypothetical protein